MTMVSSISPETLFFSKPEPSTAPTPEPAPFLQSSSARQRRTFEYTERRNAGKARLRLFGSGVGTVLDSSAPARTGGNTRSVGKPDLLSRSPFHRSSRPAFPMAQHRKGGPRSSAQEHDHGPQPHLLLGCGAVHRSSPGDAAFLSHPDLERAACQADPWRRDNPRPLG